MSASASAQTIAPPSRSPFEQMAEHLIARPTMAASRPPTPMTDQLRRALATGRALTSAELGATIDRPASAVFPLLKGDIARGLGEISASPAPAEADDDPFAVGEAA